VLRSTLRQVFNRIHAPTVTKKVVGNLCVRFSCATSTKVMYHNDGGDLNDYNATIGLQSAKKMVGIQM
jgi:hypothetical protein